MKPSKAGPGLRFTHDLEDTALHLQRVAGDRQGAVVGLVRVWIGDLALVASVPALEVPDAKVKLLIPAYDTFSRKMFLFKSYDSSTNEIKIWEACKASSSAPTYFPAHIQEIDGVRRPLIDGGVFANNPAMLGLAEAINIMEKDSASDFEEERKIVLISLGTGSLQRRIEASVAEKWGPIQWVRPLIDVLFDGTAELSHMCAQHIVRTRMQVSLSGVSDDLDDATEKNLTLLKTIAQDHMRSDDGLKQISQITELLRN